MNDSAQINDPVHIGELAVQSYLRGTKKLQRYIEPMAKGLEEARHRYPLDIEFGEWLRSSHYADLGKTDRAALIKLGQDTWDDDLRSAIAAMPTSSPELIARQLYSPVSDHRNPGNDDTPDDEDDDDSGYYGSERHVRSNEAWDTIDPRLVPALLQAIPTLRKRKIWEPAAGRGLMAGQLHKAGCSVAVVTDIAPRADGISRMDFFVAEVMMPNLDAIVTNPPWGRLAAPFIRHALELARPARALVAMLVPIPWLTAAGVADMTGDAGLEAIVVPRFRAKWMTDEEEAELAKERAAAGKSANVSPKMNHIWVIWDFARDAALLPAVMFVDRPIIQEAETLLDAAE